ncbi:EF-hand domain-containing protein [Cellulophaga sp. 20_2_10]|uniref:EF-hand domain-containing protein n=1 Tax=Cellulophaga sp. 20_2_10 TaxID=2942476 RepID=UPI00201A5396|nr:EF-hand domain-containing protein [Cellulophaga sp. 20_2_10]MCL5244553.1 EF-hand domain-containing protein [Cellulophaga sp. 20_2_10]
MISTIVKKGVLATVMIAFGVLGVKAQPPKGEQGKRPTIEELFKQMDANKDGKLSKKEVKGPLKDDFKKIDANEDGFLSKKEIEKMPKRKSKKPTKN